MVWAGKDIFLQPLPCFGDGFSPELVFGAVSGFRFGFWFWVPRHSTQSEPASLPFLDTVVMKDVAPEIIRLCLFLFSLLGMVK